MRGKANKNFTFQNTKLPQKHCFVQSFIHSLMDNNVLGNMKQTYHIENELNSGMLGNSIFYICKSLDIRIPRSQIYFSHTRDQIQRSMMTKITSVIKNA
jgi:hypothetical protein